MAEVLTVIEHETVPIVRSRADGQKELSQRHANLLEKLEKKLPAKAWSWGNHEIKFTSHCGVVSLGDLSIEILPKIYGKEAENSESSRRVLIRMLSKAPLLKLHEAGPAGISSQKRNILDVFILHFCEQLRAQLTRGMIRKYLKRERNLNVLRGKLVIEQQLKRNLAHRERLFCRYDELSADNAYNQILKYVLGILLKATTTNLAFRQVSELLMRFEVISDRAATAGEIDSLSFDRLTERYESVFYQCRYFLEKLYPDVVTGKKNCLAVLFDMNRLFEAYVAAELRKEVRSQGLRVREQGPRRYLARLKGSDKPIFSMKPDISFVDGKNHPVAVADVKWKILDEREKDLGISQADMYQIGSYASRYGVKSVVLLYPFQERLTRPVRMTLEGTETTLLVQPVDISDHSPALARAILSFLSSSSLSEASVS